MPFPGPQTRALNSKADILFFGGAAGGGKTYLLLGLAATQHHRSLIFRREFKQLEDIREKAERLYHNIGSFNGQRELWRLETDGIKRRVRFGAMQLPGDEQAYQGQQMDLHCVGRGTPVLMADGSRKAIERVCLGDLVETLEGPGRVVRLLPMRREAGVRVTAYDQAGNSIGSQVQSRQHSLLTLSGWVSLGDRAYPPLLIYVGPPNPNRSEGDGREGTPRYKGQHRRKYPHPYRTETRSTSADLTVARWDFSSCGEVDLYDIEVDEVNHYISGPGFVSKNCFDEITHFTESQFRFVTGWNRSDVPGQRSRVIAAGNPPTNAEGYWVLKFWAPWLDPKYPNPAKDGELRWFAQLKDKNGRFIDMEVPDATPINVPGEPYPVKPRSRTFIRAFLTDNPVYMASGYMSVLQSMPEPLRSQMLHGDFLVGHEDHPRQVIPTEWVMMAQARWRPKSELDARIRMDCIGIDVARGGKDNFVMSPRYGTWFDEQITFPGTETPNGFAALELIVAAIPTGERPALNIDVVGVGGSVYDLAKASGLAAFAMDARHTSYARDSSGALGFTRKKSEWWWKLREALDPNLGDDLALPPDRQILADLTAPRYEMKTSGIQVEDKEDLISRIGRSPDNGDAIVLAHASSVAPISTHLL